MKTGPGKKSYQAFTLTELLVILAILAVLACIQVSALSVSKDQTRIAQCSGNLKQIAMSLQLYGADWKDNLPPASVLGTGWAWDIYWGTGDAFVRYGSSQRTLYCPGTAVRFTDADNLSLYNYASNSFHVIGYVPALSGSSLFLSNTISSLIPQSTTISGPLGNVKLPPASPAKIVLAADATLSTGGQNPSARYFYNWITVQGGYSKPHLSAHLNGQFPAGANVSMIDGHVEWRRFDDMQARGVGSGGASPTFWW